MRFTGLCGWLIDRESGSLELVEFHLCYGVSVMFWHMCVSLYVPEPQGGPSKVML